jgi:hypothetical protein
MRPKPLSRSEYLIDRHHVIFDPGAGWQCACPEFKAMVDCRHIRESQGRHAAQAVIADRMRSPLTQSGHRLLRD